MRLFRAELTLQGILVFSSEVRPMISAGKSMGSYISTSPYVHNYPVMYGLMGKSSEAYFVIPSLHEADYADRKGKGQSLKYTSVKRMIDDFASGKDGAFYAFPLLPRGFTVSSFLFSAESWSYVIPTRGDLKNVFPRLTSYSAIMPGSRFITFIAVNGDARLPRYIRIGKKRWGIFKVDYEEVGVERVEKRRDAVSSIPVNRQDSQRFGFRVKSFAKVLETPNLAEGEIGWATFEECNVFVGSTEIRGERVELCLPLPSS